MAFTKWAQLDGWGQPTNRYEGTVDELKDKLRKGIEEVVEFEFQEKPRASIYLPGRQVRVRCPMLIMKTPWGRYRYIPARFL